ncbi:EF-hand domain-containing protein [Sphingomonas oligophenolica]|uniref:Histidine kinase n=1 Tax=Sphingomonas oligophenolica TaxID=301154 RepID=A0A502CMW8_9SPHN|nr:EF-hand domain-containing protein [Sphingomonas oligophenolica]TPG14248.1 histidine kinase [Sphingomonas oligophenolica]
MWRYLAGGAAALAMVGAGTLVFGNHPSPAPLLPSQPMASQSGELAADPLADIAPAATDRTREQKRFDRYDKDRDGKVMRDEYLMQRRKAFAKLDTDHDGRLSFDEWAIKATTKFTGADADKSGAMTAAEFATTAVKRKAPARAKCPPAPPREEAS